MDPKVSYGLGVMMVCHCGFMDPKLMGGVDSGGDCGGERGVWEISVPSPEFCYKSKTALRDEVYIKKKKNTPKLDIASAIEELTFKCCVYVGG